MAHYHREELVEDVPEDYADVSHFFHSNSRAIEAACSFDERHASTSAEAWRKMNVKPAAGTRVAERRAELNTHDAFELYNWSQMKSLLSSSGTGVATTAASESREGEEEKEKRNRAGYFETPENVEKEDQHTVVAACVDGNDGEKNDEGWEMVEEGERRAAEDGEEEGDDGGWVLEGKSFLFAPFRAALMRGLRKSHEEDGDESDDDGGISYGSVASSL